MSAIHLAAARGLARPSRIAFSARHLQHALAAPDPSEAEEASAQSPLGGRAPARLQVLDVALGLPLLVYGAVRIQRPRHAKYWGRISVKSASSPPS